jgi:hypothetical protein
MFGNQININKLKRQRDELDNWINNYENSIQPSPVNNFISTNQPSNNQNKQNNLIEMRVLNENEQVDNLYVQNKTLFIGTNLMILKDEQGKLEKWEINKFYPVDEKEQKIKALEEEIKQLKEMIVHEPKHSESIKSIESSNESISDANGDTKSPTTKSSKSIQK